MTVNEYNNHNMSIFMPCEYHNYVYKTSELKECSECGMYCWLPNRNLQTAQKRVDDKITKLAKQGLEKLSELRKKGLVSNVKFELTEEFSKYISNEVLDLLVNRLGLSAHVSYGVVDDIQHKNGFIRLNIDIKEQ